MVDALDPPHRIGWARDFADLETLLQAAKPQACVLDVFHPPPPIPLSRLGRLRRRHPTVALVIASDFSGREMDLYHLGRLSVDGVIRMEDRPSGRDILTVVDRAIAASLATRVVEGSGDELPFFAREAIRWAIERAESRPQVSELAAALAMSPGAFTRGMKAASLGSARSLLLWGRLIRASHLLERSSETVESVAFRLGYSSGGALGKALKRHVGSSPTELLQRGGVEWTLAIFRKNGLRSIGRDKKRKANRGS